MNQGRKSALQDKQKRPLENKLFCPGTSKTPCRKTDCISAFPHKNTRNRIFPLFRVFFFSSFYAAHMSKAEQILGKGCSSCRLLSAGPAVFPRCDNKLFHKPRRTACPFHGSCQAGRPGGAAVQWKNPLRPYPWQNRRGRRIPS